MEAKDVLMFVAIAGVILLINVFEMQERTLAECEAALEALQND